MVSVFSATIGQLLRSGQRDEQYVTELTNELSQLVRYWVGIRPWIQWRHHLHHLSQLMYYSATTLSGLQTLGEEYLNIVQTDANKISVPKFFKRLIDVILLTFGPFLLSRLLASLKRRLEDRRKVLPLIVDSDDRRELLLKLIPIIDESFQYIHKIHLIVFYLNGNYYHLSKRLTQIRYISLNRTDTQSVKIYKVLGYLSLIQLCLSLWTRLATITKSLQKSNRRLESTSEPTSVKPSEDLLAPKCSLCLEKRRNTSLTPCGHLFCWYCIHEWLQMKNECPLCREHLQSSRIVLLQNYC